MMSAERNAITRALEGLDTLCCRARPTMSSTVAMALFIHTCHLAWLMEVKLVHEDRRSAEAQ